MKQKIINYIRAGYPGLYLVSPEEQRVEAEMKQIVKDLKYSLIFWSAVDGLVDTSKGSTTAANDPLEALIAIRDLKEKTLILLRDFHLFPRSQPHPHPPAQRRVAGGQDQIQNSDYPGLSYDLAP
jgi:hypothetical protein